MKGFLIVTVVAMLCAGTAYSDQIRELGKRVNWNEDNGKTKDFILTVRFKEGGTVFCPSFIVHPMTREEDFPKDMETVELNESGLRPR